MKKTLLLLLIIFLFKSSKSQTDTLFWFAVPEVSLGSSAGGNLELDRPIFFRISTLNQAAQVTISMPANNTFTPIIINIPSNSTNTIDVSNWIELFESKPNNIILNKGLLIRSSANINIYYEVQGGPTCSCNPELFVLKGRNALGKDFIIPAQNLLNNNINYSPQPLNGFDIVASEASSITIILTKPANGRAPNVPFTINLKRGESFSVRSDSYLADQHLGGSRIQSTGKIAITVKDDLMDGGPIFGGGCSDLGGDQILPISLLGTEYIAVKGFLWGQGDQFFVTALDDNTQVSVNGNLFGIINKSETLRIPFGTNEAIYVSSNKIIANIHLSGFGCETGLESLPNLNCTGSRKVSIVRATNEDFFLNITCKANAITGFTLNGNNSIISPSIFQSVPGTNDIWKYAKIQIETNLVPSSGICIVENSLGRFQLGVIHGSQENTGCRYGYFTDFSSVNIQAGSNKTNFCIGDTLKLSYNSTAFGTPAWRGPNGFLSNELLPFHIIKSLKDSGYYYININDPECGLVKDSVFIKVDSIGVKAGNNSIICLNDSIQLNATVQSNLSIKWLPSIGLSNPAIKNPKASPQKTTTYIIEVSNGQCSAYDSILITVNPKPNLIISKDTTICFGSSVQLTATGGVNYSWNPATFLNNSSISNPISTPTTSITYNVKTFGANQCIDSNTVTINVITKETVKIMPDTSICGPQTIKLRASGGDKYLWQPGNYFNDSTLSEPVVNLTRSQQFKVQIINTQCSDTINKIINIQVDSLPIVFLNKANDINCLLTESLLKATGAATYSWFPPNWLSNPYVSNPITKPDSTITYFVIGKSNKGCIDTASITIFVNFNGDNNSIYIPNAFTPNKDGLNDCFRLAANNQIVIEFFEIYNRWGQIIWSSKDPNECWDGTYNHVEQIPGYYPYRIKAKGNCGQIIKNGWIQLIR